MTVVHREDVELLERLGGSDAEVHRAIVRPSGRVVVAKHTTWSRSDVSDRLGRAAAILERVEHPGLVRLVARIEDDRGPCLLLANEPGGSLADRLARGGTRPAPAVAALGTRLAEALAALHDAGVVHRDVHPGNVLLDAALRPVLVDLDDALDRSSPPLPGDAEVVGHPDHVDHRVVAGRPADAASDLYGLATTLWAAATGAAPPRDGPADAVVLQPHPAVPGSLHEVLVACLRGTVGDADSAAARLRTVARDLGASSAARPGRSEPSTARGGPHDASSGRSDRHDPDRDDDTRDPAAGGATPIDGDGAAAAGDDFAAAAGVGDDGTQRWGAPTSDLLEEPSPDPGSARHRRTLTSPTIATVAGVAALLVVLLATTGPGDGQQRVAPPPVCTPSTAPLGQQVTADLDGDGCGEHLGFVDAELHLPDGRYLVGQAGDVLLAGDWDSDGRWGIGLYRPTTGEVFLIDDPGPGASSGPPQQHRRLGNPTVVEVDGRHQVRVEPAQP